MKNPQLLTPVAQLGLAFFILIYRFSSTDGCRYPGLHSSSNLTLLFTSNFL
ncbi:uncharacterized protein PHACADRAFT_258306, partial [Phanerochaete carnosa HHB-10118-sp]